MRRLVWITASVVVGVGTAVVVRLVTGSGAWWLWLLLGGLTVAAVLAAVKLDRNPRDESPNATAPRRTQRIVAKGGGRVVDSPQTQHGGAGAATQEIKAIRRGVVSGSAQEMDG